MTQLTLVRICLLAFLFMGLALNKWLMLDGLTVWNWWMLAAVVAAYCVRDRA